MSGHSKWSKVKHYKGAVDAKRGQVFSKIAKELTVAAKLGGGDPGFNPRLRSVLLKARSGNMPADNIDRAIKKGTGELPGVVYEEATYEGFAPGGVGVLVEVLTDNKNRAAAEIRTIFTRQGGHLAGTNAVQHLFHRKGHFLIPKDAITEDDLLELIIEAGAEDLIPVDDAFEVTTDPHQFDAVQKALEGKGTQTQTAEISYLPSITVPLSDERAAKPVLNLIEALQEHEDVQNVHANYDIPDEVMEKINAAA